MISFEFEMGERVIHVGCYGSGTDWLCRLTDATANQSGYSEAYKTQPDLGSGCACRPSRASGWPRTWCGRRCFPETDAVRKLMEEIMHRAIRDDWGLNWVIEFVQTNWQATLDGEEGHLEWGRR